MFNLVSIESNALVVVNGLKNLSSHCSEFCDQLANVSNLLSYFPSAQVSYMHHNCNKTTHSLSQYALSWMMNLCNWRKIHI